MSSSDEDVEDALDREKITATSLDKYMAAAKALNGAIGVVVAACTPGASILDICQLGDSTITKNLEGVFKKSYNKKGLAFPTCLSVNSDVCHVSPLTSDTELNEKDIVRIEMACHVDGYTASLVHTLFVTRVPLAGSVAGRAADVICAVQKAGEIISDVVWPGVKMQDFNKIIQGVAACFSCKVLGTSGCRLLKQYEAKDSSFSIPISDDGEFLRDRVYTVDIAFASEQEELELSDETEATVYRSMVDADYELPDEALRLIFDEIVQKFPKFPFCVRSLVNFSRAGISACVQHGILEPYHIRHQKSGLFAHMRFTLLVRALKTSSITETPQQVLHPMVPVELHGGIDLLWAKYKGRGKAQTKLSYCGRLPVGEESCGFKPYVSDVSWNKVARSWRDASDALACTGSFGTYIYLRSKSITIRLNENIEDGWEKVAIQNIPGKFCKWSPCGVYLAVGLVTDAGIPEVYIFHWEAAEIISRIIYVGNANFCL